MFKGSSLKFQTPDGKVLDQGSLDNMEVTAFTDYHIRVGDYVYSRADVEELITRLQAVVENATGLSFQVKLSQEDEEILARADRAKARIEDND